LRVSIGDVRIYFDVVGMGLVPDGPRLRERPVLLVLHGGPAFDHTVSKHLLAPLQDVAQVVFIDQRACGRSDVGPREKWNLDAWIDDIAAFCSTLELEHPILLGQSFGGFVALGVAARYPELPARLIVSSSAARVRQGRALAMFERLGGPEIREVAARWFEDPNPVSGEEYRRRCLPYYNPSKGDPDVFARTIFREEVGIHFWGDEIRRVDLRPELARIRCPTLILSGELDPIITVRDQEELAEAIPASLLFVFEGAGHGVWRDKPDEALAAIRDFIREPATR
jgi:pimeloyl-ACP methyl ester carboxylesterase